MIEQALKIFRSRPYLRNEVAQTTYKMGQIYLSTGDNVRARQEFREAHSLRRRLRPQDKRPVEEMKESDYDELVIFWSR